MSEPFRGSEAVAAGALSKSALRSRYRRLFPDVYLNRDSDLTPINLAKAGWLWSGRAGVVAGRSAAALHGAGWVGIDQPVDVIHSNRSAPGGITAHGDRTSADEIVVIDGISVTNPARTALDVGCWYPIGQGDADSGCPSRRQPSSIRLRQRLFSSVTPGGAEYGMRGALSHWSTQERSRRKETWLRLLLIDGGLPRPQTQIPIRDDAGIVFAYLDLGWEEFMVAVEYDGDQHRTDRRQYTWDVRRLELLERLGWTVIRVVAGDRRDAILQRVRTAIARRASPKNNVRHSA